MESLVRKNYLKKPRKLPFAYIVLLLCYLIRFKQKSGYDVVIGRFWSEAKRCNIPLISDKPTGPAFSKARRKVPSAEIRRLNTKAASYFDKKYGHNYLWKGKRVYAVDGTKLLLSSHPAIVEAFGKPTNQKTVHYAMALASTLYNVFSKVSVDMTVTKYRGNERKQARELMERNLSPGDVVILDSGYYCYDLLQLFTRLKARYIMRVPLKGTFSPVERFIASGKNNGIVQLSEPKTGRTFDVRVIVYEASGEEPIALITDLLSDSEYPAREIARLYHFRWESEELYKAGKHLSKLENFHARYADGIHQEIHAWNLMYTLSRILEAEARVRDGQSEDPSPEAISRTEINLTETSTEAPGAVIVPDNGSIRNFNGLQGYNFKNSLETTGYYLQELSLSNDGVRNQLLFESAIGEIRSVRYFRREGRSYRRIRLRPLPDKFYKGNKRPDRQKKREYNKQRKKRERQKSSTIT